MFDPERLENAYQICRQRLLDERNANGHWTGELATSALATATAVSALQMVAKNRSTLSSQQREQLGSVIDNGIGYLVSRQNEDGGWGDTEKNYSNISTTMLAVAALTIAGRDVEFRQLIDDANRYIDDLGRVDGLRKRYGEDKTFAVPILANCAIAGLVDWKDVSPLPFEAACLPQKFYRFMRLHVVSYAIPALVAIGQARFLHAPPWNPLMRAIRSLSVKRSLDVLLKMQPASGGYLEAVPLTSFVVMSLADTGRADHEVVTNGIKFLLESVREDGSWPIDTNLATFVTTLAVNGLANSGEDVAALDCWDWILSCQHTERHPFTGADPGGWGWTDLSGAVPDADDTPGALLALNAWRCAPTFNKREEPRIRIAAIAGLKWLLDLQNSDGGWPTFCRGWGKLPFDRSGDDLTAHALRAIKVWEDVSAELPKTEHSVARGFKFLQQRQNEDGSWTPLWFGNQDQADDENNIYGTAKVLLAYRDYNKLDSPEVQRGWEWLTQQQNNDGGWGGGEKWRVTSGLGRESSVEETSLAIEALLPTIVHRQHDERLQRVLEKGLEWLVSAVEEGPWYEDSPIGFYFAKLWYHERLYPVTFCVAALGHARLLVSQKNHQHPTDAIPPN
ncbi:MAG: squalene-hopene/tetraprenyl-beta-curcumene cyclase [Pirellulaceae bacterium]|jgi:squalene-hopene/tetraprenyl-beta-curcumene cyclase